MERERGREEGRERQEERERENVSSTKYLGIALQHNAKFDQHTDAVVAKTNRTLGFLRRYLGIRKSNIKAQAYKCLVLPILEYSCTVQHRKTWTG